MDLLAQALNEYAFSSVLVVQRPAKEGFHPPWLRIIDRVNVVRLFVVKNVCIGLDDYVGTFVRPEKVVVDLTIRGQNFFLEINGDFRDTFRQWGRLDYVIYKNLE